MIGQTVSHYKILEKLGEGGMGVVYKATDTRLDRIVALKFLPEHLLNDSSAKARFIHEAKGASAINHQNITMVYDIGEVNGKSFIAMEYLEGKSVKELAKENLKLNRVLEIAIQIAEGLSAAHNKEIIHRDIKSENVMVTKDDVVKIMDFGLAKLKGVSKLTESGATVGTIAYMSPEQTRSEEVDSRSDIFSLGVVLYELITGKLPFQGDHNAAIIYSICYEEPEPLARYKANLPEGLQRIIEKSLNKDKKVRYQSVPDLLADLKGLQKEVIAGSFVISPKRKAASRVILFAGIPALLLIAGYLIFSRSSTTNTKKPMLAVLPFRNLGPPDQEYFADGITDEITTNLAKISGLGVISNTSTIQYKQTKKNLREIGKELGVDYVLEGSINLEKLGSSNRVRINPQLIWVKNDTHVWAEIYNGVSNDILDIQTNISEKITRALKIVLTEPEQNFLKQNPTKSVEAYDAYLHGLHKLEQNQYLLDCDQLLIAIENFKKAIDLDASFALAYALLSKSYALEASRCSKYAKIDVWRKGLRNSFLMPRDMLETKLKGLYSERFQKKSDSIVVKTYEGSWEKAMSAANQALVLKPELPEAHLSLGYSYYWRNGDYERALKEFTIAQKDQPNNSDLSETLGEI